MDKRTLKREIKQFAKEADWIEGQDNDMAEEEYEMTLLGVYMDLDPCGRFHHPLSPNNIKNKCISYWNKLEEVCYDLGMWIEESDYDGCDVYLCRPKK